MNTNSEREASERTRSASFMPSEKIEDFDEKLIGFIKKYAPFANRAAVFTVFFWFGILKVMNMSPADMIVKDLLLKIWPSVPFSSFFIFLGVYEMILGVLFIIPKGERIALPFLFVHMATTFLPLFLLTDSVWQGPFSPSIEGQYIIKNLVVIALALNVAAGLTPIKKRASVT